MATKDTTNQANSTLIIGGGWSGLAAAVSLSQQGNHVHLIESAKQLGGRARNVHWQQSVIDNGQHLMIGAYKQMLAMMELIGVDTQSAFHRQSIDIVLHDTQHPSLHLSAQHAWLPWPLSLAWNLTKSTGANGLYKIYKLHSSIPKILNNNDITVSEWLLSTKQPNRLIKQLWEPLCLATLNTPIKEASAHLLATVIRDSLGAGKSAADSLIPTCPLGDLFPSYAANYIKQNGGTISLQSRAKQLLIDENKVTGIQLQDGSILNYNNIIVACSPAHSIDLVVDHIAINKPLNYPIFTAYLQYPADTRLSKPILGLTGTVSQWAFDRSEQTPGLMAIVISGPGKHETMTNDELSLLLSRELRQMCPDLVAAPLDSLIIREKRATFASTVNIEKQRPNAYTDISGLWLAGDYVANGYPATLEGAIRNGEQCAKLILEHTAS
ncbi:hydroxysqualene dehydroxylase HpnE [Pseudomonadota bacterium]|nr:hydroxysqualene dehydroxylase HpnE [Pseudomonadota bacterium]